MRDLPEPPTDDGRHHDGSPCSVAPPSCAPRPRDDTAIGWAIERAMLDLGFRAAQSAEVRELVDAREFRAALALLGVLAGRNGRDPSGWLERIGGQIDPVDRGALDAGHA
jgi:hypothetical protein